jgi:hypothetical protein
MANNEAAVEPEIQPGSPEHLSEAELEDIVGGAAHIGCSTCCAPA